MDIYELANHIHELYCQSSHIDQCGWEYENARQTKWDEKYSAHDSYLRRAKNIVEELPQYSPEDIVAVIRGIKTGMHKGRW
jgi:hypothetical protein